MKKIKTAISISPEVKKTIDDMAKENGLHFSTYVEIVLREAIKEKNKKDRSML